MYCNQHRLSTYTRIKSVFRFGFFLFLIGGILVSCETDLAEVDRIASIQEEEPVDISINVTIIYSDSAKVKAKITAPEMRRYHLDNSYIEFQKGIEIIFFDEIGEETQRIRSDYAIQREIEEITEFRGNVKITRSDGLYITTEELIRDEKQNKFYNHVPLTIHSSNGMDTFHGMSFESDGDFNNIVLQNTTGVYHTSGNLLEGN